jgi:hypothetical protein
MRSISHLRHLHLGATKSPGAPLSLPLALDPIHLNRIKGQSFRLSVILSENRMPLFGIML